MAVKLIQLLKLRKDAQQSVVNFILKLLNEDTLRGQTGNFFEILYKQFDADKVWPNEKERYILNSLPNIKIATYALLAYKCKEAAGYLNAILAFQMETAQFPLDFFNEYTLSLRGRTSQGVVLFKNQMLALVDKSKQIPTKPDVSEA